MYLLISEKKREKEKEKTFNEGCADGSPNVSVEYLFQIAV